MEIVEQTVASDQLQKLRDLLLKSSEILEFNINNLKSHVENAHQGRFSPTSHCCMTKSANIQTTRMSILLLQGRINEVLKPETALVN